MRDMMVCDSLRWGFACFARVFVSCGGGAAHTVCYKQTNYVSGGVADYVCVRVCMCVRACVRP